MVAWFGQKLSRNLLALWQCSGESEPESPERRVREVGGWVNCSNDAQIEEGLGGEGTISSNCTAEMRGLHRFLFQNKLHQIWECWKRLDYSEEQLLGAEFRFELQLSLIQWSLNHGIIFEEKLVNVGSGDVCEKGVGTWESVRQAWWFDLVWHVQAELPSAGPTG